MKFYNSVGPNPQAVRVFAAEKGITLEKAEVDLMKGANREAAHLARNPAGQTPALETDGGQFISEITAICEYLEEKFPTPALIGSTPEERAETRMWVRRMDENVIVPRLMGFRYAEGAQLFAPRIPVFPEAAAPLKALAKDREAWLDKMLDGPDHAASLEPDELTAMVRAIRVTEQEQACIDHMAKQAGVSRAGYILARSVCLLCRAKGRKSLKPIRLPHAPIPAKVKP